MSNLIALSPEEYEDFKKSLGLIKQIAVDVAQIKTGDATQPADSTAPVKPLPIEEAARFLSVSHCTLRRWRKEGILKGQVIGKKIYFFPDDLIRVRQNPAA